MIFNMNGGGGVSLNFAVVGGTSKPSSPRDNTIWVNTNKTISSWIFANTEPAEPSEGMVLIGVGNFSEVAFNALKNAEMMVYPMYAKQYVNAAWVDVPAETYQKGEWHDWYPYGYLFSSQYGLNPANTLVLSNSDNYSTITANEKTIDFNTQAGGNFIGIGFAEQMDLSKFSTLNCRLYLDSSRPNHSDPSFRARLGIKNTVLKNGDIVGTDWVASDYNTSYGDITISVDISAVNIGYVMLIGVMSGTLYDIWLE